MLIQKLFIQGIRNLSDVSLNHLAGINFFIGENGAGKTSLLEGIAIASLGRSFRNHKIPTVINEKETKLTVFIECQDEDQKLNKLGIERDRQHHYLVRVNGQSASTLAELSTILPIVVLDAGAFHLLDGSPSVRRRFIDWGVFHVEHGFYQQWKSFNKILKQRNALLRSRQDDYSLYEPWDMEFVNLAIQIERYRMSFLKKYQPVLNDAIHRLDQDLEQQQIFYKNGWGLERLDFSSLPDLDLQLLDRETLLDALKKQFSKDLRYQRTHIGPHKSDIQIRVNKNDAKDIYSRGQKKSLVAAMKLAQANIVKQERGKKPVLLLDDLPSELDNEHLQRFLGFITHEDYQCFITAVDERIYHQNMSGNARMFHVERGKITPVTAEGDSLHE